MTRILRLMSPILGYHSTLARFFRKRKDNLYRAGAKKSIVYHCASLGEYELIKPVIQNVRDKSVIQNVVSFFSPSGYQRIPKSEYVDFVTYSPLEIKSDIQSWIDLWNPQCVVFSSNDIWPVFIDQLYKHKIPILFIGTDFKNTWKRRSWLRLLKPFLEKADHFFVHDESSLRVLKSIGVHTATVVGNIRLESIRDSATQQKNDNTIESFKGDLPLIVFGSTHSSDMEKLAPAIRQLADNHRILIAPHEPNESSFAEIRECLNLDNLVFYSSFQADQNSRIMILDTFGILKSIYAYADVIYVGGGFDKSVHNVFEALIHRKMVIIGPKYEKFTDVTELVDRDLICSISSSKEFRAVINKTDRVHFQSTVSDYVVNLLSAPKRSHTIADYILQKININEE